MKFTKALFAIGDIKRRRSISVQKKLMRTLVPDSSREPGAGIVIKDAIADITLQQVLTRPEILMSLQHSNLNGDYLSDALAAQVGGIGIAPGGNINYVTGHAIFEATHGTAPKYANQDKSTRVLSSSPEK